VVAVSLDLLAALAEYDRGAVYEALARVMPTPRVIEVSARTGDGVDAWLAWLGRLNAANATAGERHLHGKGGLV
jgi:hydrogenase nickel incorporation protein HypB